MNPFVGRQNELAQLKKLLQKRTSSLVVIKGRRRIGKSRLAQEFGKLFTQTYFFTGIPPIPGTTSQDQKNEFKRQMNQYGIMGTDKNDWGDLFYAVSKECKNGKTLVILDEISWMGAKEPTFLGKLKIAWDVYFKQNPHLIMILSGSQSTWIEKNIINSTGFLGRISYTLTLEELSLWECSEFWGAHQKNISVYEKIKILSVTGGVPRYLEEINPKKTAEENILDLCFVKGALLSDEFNHIFSDLFSKRSEKYKTIVKKLIEGAAFFEDISRALNRHKKGHSKGGDISEYLNDLEQTGFISRDHTWDIKKGKSSKLSQYRLSDNYSRFYLKYIEPNKTITKNQISAGLPDSWLTILGLQFENLVLSQKNRQRLYQILDIPLHEIVMANPFFQRKNSQYRGCQIDLLIQTKHNVLYLCEIKFSKNEIKGEVVDEVKQKIERLALPRGFSVRPVLIHVNGVSDEVLEKEFFANIVGFDEFFISPEK